MKKTYPLQVEGKHPDRVLDALKHDLRKYVRRERRRDLPEGVDFWDFACRVGRNEQEAQPVHLAALNGQVDEVAKAGATQVYVEILTRHGHRKARSLVPTESASTDEAAD
jgi:Family of unknown function (DUF6172)